MIDLMDLAETASRDRVEVQEVHCVRRRSCADNLSLTANAAQAEKKEGKQPRQHSSTSHHSMVQRRFSVHCAPWVEVVLNKVGRKGSNSLLD